MMPPDPQTAPADPHHRPTLPLCRALLQSLQHGLLEREIAASVLLLAGLAAEHVLLMGPPGTAKSQLARRLQGCFSGAAYFERLLTRFTTPEELFGPLSLKALEDDRYERLSAGFLPTAGIAFLDEVFKAHSAILNTLLGVLNERVFDNGTQRLPVPLISLVGASNEAPEDDGLAAFHDRFLLQVPVMPVSDGRFTELLNLPPEAETETPQSAAVTEAERRALIAQSHSVRLGASAEEGLAQLRGWLAAQQQRLSDRRWRQALRLMRVAAAAEGREELDMLDLWVAPYFASTKALSAQALSDWVQRELLGAVPHAFTGFQRAVEAFEAQLNIESSLPATAEGPPGSPSDGSAGDGAGKMALARRYSDVEAGIDSPSAEPLRISSRLLEERLRRKFSRLHVNARLAELQALQQAIEGQRDSALSALAVLRHSLTGRVWPPAAIRDPWLSAHELKVQTCESLLYRLEAVTSGFANLPLDADSEAPPALAIAWDELAEA